MQLHHVLSILAAGVIGRTFAASNKTSDHQPATWDPCPGITFDAGGESDVPAFEAECLVFQAPMCYSGVCKAPANVNPNIGVFVKRLAASGDNAKKASNVLLLPGGPGISSYSLEWVLHELHTSLGGAVNVYLMEHRGTGRSTRLDCVGAQSTTSGSPSGAIVEPSEVPSCAQDLQKKYGNLASFSTTSAAMDISTFISKYTNGASTIVFGRSYGTMVAQRLMQLNPKAVTGYVLDGIMASAVAPDKKYYNSSRDTMVGEVGERFMDLCTQDGDCASHFKGTSLSATLHDVLSKFDKDPDSTCAALVTEYTKKTPSIGLRRHLGNLLEISLVPAIIAPFVYRLNRCDSSDIKPLTQFLQISTQENSNVDGSESLESRLLTNLVFYSEMWETPTPYYVELQTRFMNASMANQAVYDSLPGYCAYSKDQSPQCAEYGVGKYEANGIIYPHDQYWDKPAKIPSHVSVLLMSGGFDIVTPSKYAEFLFEALDTSKKELVKFDYSPHSLLANTAFGDGDKKCGMELLISYVASKGDLSRLDKSCMAQMPAFKMTVPPEPANYFFGTSDAYGEVLTPTGHNESITPA